MTPVTSWQENQNCAQNAVGLNSTFAMTPVPRLLCNSTTKDSVSEERTFLLLTLADSNETGAGSEGEGIRAQDSEWCKDMEWDPSTTLYFTLPRGGTEALRSGQDTSSSFPALHLLAPAPWEIIQSGSILLGRGQSPASLSSEGVKGGPTSPTHWAKNYTGATWELQSGQSLKICPFSNVNNIKMFQ